MNRSKTLQAALATVVGLGIAAGAQARDRHHDRDEATLALAAQTSVAAAVATAEQQTGGRAMKVEFEKENGKPAYEVRVLSKGALSLVYVDPDTGKVIGTKAKTGRGDRDDGDEMAEIAAAPTTLGAAIHAAKAKTGARAVEARVRDVEGIVFYRIEVAKGQTVNEVTVDSAGKVVRVSAAEEDEDRDEDHHHGHREHHEHEDHDED